MRTQRTPLFQTLKSRWQGTDFFSASVSSVVLAGWVLAGIGLSHPLAYATEIEVNSISEELHIMADELPVQVSPQDAQKKTPEPLAPPQDTVNVKDTDKEKLRPSPATSTDAPTNSEATPAERTKPDSTAATPPSGESELPKAKSVDLAQPITSEELQATPTKTLPPSDAPSGAATPSSDKESEAKPKASGSKPQPPAQGTDLPTKGADSAVAPTPAEPKAPQTAPGKGETSLADPQQDTAAPDPVSPEQPAPVAPKPEALPEPEPDLKPKPEQPKSLLILGTEVPPSTATRLAWSPSQSFEGLSMPTPVLVVNGAKDGPTVCLTAAIHGDELNGIEVVRRVLYGLNPKELTGAVIGVPIVNLQGFRRGSRYLTDRRDLNRYFPGNPHGSSGARIAHSFFNSVIRHCDVLVDLHTGSFDRINLPQVRADLRHPGSARLTHNFGATVVLHGTGAEGTLRRAATEYGIPAVTLEAGGPMRLEEANVSHGVAAIRTLLNSLGMIKKFSFWGKPEPVYYQSSWVRVDHGGILFSNVDLGQKVKAGDVLGTVTDPITNIRHPILSTHDGRVIGMALNQVMLPGYAAYHIGIAAKDEINALPADDALLLNDTDLSLSDEDLSELTAQSAAD